MLNNEPQKRGTLAVAALLVLGIILAVEYNSRKPANVRPAEPEKKTARSVRLVDYQEQFAEKSIKVSDGNAVYELGCNPKASSCLTPRPYVDYEYVDSGPRLQTLKDYLESYPNAPTVALVGPESKSQPSEWFIHNGQESKPLPIDTNVGIYFLKSIHVKKAQ